VGKYLLPLLEVEERIASPRVVAIIPNERDLLVDRIILNWSKELCGQNVELLNVKLVVHIVTTGL